VAKPSPWPVIHAERAALADDLDGLTEEQWTTPSWIPPWTVLDVLGHMTATAQMSPARFVGKMAAAGFRFQAMTNREVARITADGPAAALAAFRGSADSTSSPPGPVDSWLGETIVHGEDIRRPLGIVHTYATDAVVRVADFYKGSNLLIGSKKRIDGLTLTATDTDWSTGNGPEITGPMLALLLALTGRAGVVAQLGGPGLPALKERLER
jgi:uncharacterized protein (TIGR03083 family)